jgi:spermidine/putrescine transport system substrate-binding protein
MGLTVGSAVAAGADLPHAAAAPPALVLLTWEDYIDPEIVEEFQRSRGVPVREVHFETDDHRDEILVKSNGRDFDLVVVNSPNLPVYRRLGWLARLNTGAIPNLRHIWPQWRAAVPDSEDWGVPYFWGTTGLAYRRDLIGTDITSWTEFFEPSEQLRGRIALIRNARDVIGMALKALGHSANSTEPEAILAAEQLLRRQAPFVREIGYPSLDADSHLVTGEIWMAMMYNGDALALAEHDPDIRFVVPREGGEIWIDYLAVLDSSSRKALAADFIDFVNEPHRAARNALYVNYATPNRSAEMLLPSDFRNNPLVYPRPEVLRRCDFYVDLPPEAVRLRNRVYSQLAAGPPDQSERPADERPPP